MEMERRTACARAQEVLTNAMAQVTDQEGLTAMEWVFVLNETQRRMISHGLNEEWQGK